MDNILLTITVTMLGAGGFWTFLQWILEKLGKSTTTRKKLDCINSNVAEINHNQKVILQELESTQDLARSTARYILNVMCNKFITLGYIPYPEFTAFKTVGDAYISSGGNTDIAEKFNLCIDTLEVKDK